MKSVDAVVTGAGGFIGGHLVKSLLEQGKTVRGVDVKPLDEWSQIHPEAQNIVGNVSLLEDARVAMDGAGSARGGSSRGSRARSRPPRAAVREESARARPARSGAP